MALVFERTRRGREKLDRPEVRRLSGRPGDRGEVVARVADATYAAAREAGA